MKWKGTIPKRWEKIEDDLKDDGKDEYGLWLLVKRKKARLRVGGP